MMSAELSYFDAAVLGIMLLSCLFAFFRGFVKEILSLGAWIGAALVTLYYFRDVAEWIKPQFKNEVVAGGAAALSLYILALIAFSMLNSLIVRMMKEGSDVGMLDNALGLVFGVFRGAFIVSLGYFMLTMMMPEDQYPEWIKKAQTKPYAEKGALILAGMAPDYMVEHTSLKEKLEKDKTDKKPIAEFGTYKVTKENP